MINILLSILNCFFLVTVTFPTIAKMFSSTFQIFKLLDCMYSTVWKKFVFIGGVCMFLYRQWLNDTVKKLSKDKYELSFSINGEMSKIIIEKIYPEIVDIQNPQTDESLDKFIPYNRFKLVSFDIPPPCVIYYDDGTSSSIE